MPRVLYNDCYGDFSFSDAFVAEYEKRSGTSMEADGRLYRIGVNSIRCDPIALQLFDERGSEWSSGPDASLAVRDVPDLFALYWEIDEYSGNETVRVKVTDALADILETFIDGGDEATLRRQYAVIMAAANLGKQNNRNSDENPNAYDSGC